MKNIKFIFFILLTLFTGTSCLNSKNNEKVLRLGYMPNVTHATALFGIEKNIFKEELGDKVKFKPMYFVVGNSIIDAFITNQIDVAYVGPGPFINALYRKIPVELLSNAANGGSVLVEALHAMPLQQGEMRIAIPQYGNTQDLILRAYLDKNNLTKKSMIIAIPSQDTATTFFTMSIDAACLPEPWGTILIEKKVCKLLVNEKEILNNGNYPVTVLIASRKFTENHPNLIKKILQAHKKSNELIKADPPGAIEIVTKAISRITKKELNKTIIAKAFKRCDFNSNVDLKSLGEYKVIGVMAGYYKEGFLKEKVIKTNQE